MRLKYILNISLIYHINSSYKQVHLSDVSFHYFNLILTKFRFKNLCSCFLYVIIVLVATLLRAIMLQGVVDLYST